jgi:hypothetical protein
MPATNIVQGVLLSTVLGATIVLVGLAPKPAHAATAQCAGIHPDNPASYIRATHISCREARSVMRVFGQQYSACFAGSGCTVKGFQCKMGVYGPGNTDILCRHRSQKVAFPAEGL